MNLNQRLPPADRNSVDIKAGRFNKIAEIEGAGELLDTEHKAFLAPYMQMDDKLILKACIETDMAAASKIIAYAILRVAYPELEPEDCI